MFVCLSQIIAFVRRMFQNLRMYIFNFFFFKKNNWKWTVKSAEGHTFSSEFSLLLKKKWNSLFSYDFFPIEISTLNLTKTIIKNMVSKPMWRKNEHSEILANPHMSRDQRRDNIQTKQKRKEKNRNLKFIYFESYFITFMLSCWRETKTPAKCKWSRRRIVVRQAKFRT